MKHKGPYYGWKFAALARQKDGERQMGPLEERWARLCERHVWLAPLTLVLMCLGLMSAFLIVGRGK